MLGLQHIWFKIAIAPLVAAIQPTNPSSLTLAILAVLFATSFQLFLRPGHQNRPRHVPTISIKPRSEDAPIRPRRVA